MTKKTAVAAFAAAALALPASAEAHISLHPNYDPAKANVALGIRVPNEQDNTNTTQVDVQIPPGFLDISTGQLPGWNAKVIHRKLAQPVKTDSGTVTEEVSEIIWTAQNKQAGIPPNEFQTFPISTQIPDQAGQTLTFKAIQTYDNGTVVRWIGPPTDDHPAPTIYVAASGGVIQDVAGDEAGPGAAVQSAYVAPTGVKATKSSTGASKGLATAALVIGILGLLVGGAGLAVAVRSRRAVAVTAR